jgi:hypothetical protein
MKFQIIGYRSDDTLAKISDVQASNPSEAEAIFRRSNPEVAKLEITESSPPILVPSVDIVQPTSLAQANKTAPDAQASRLPASIARKKKPAKQIVATENGAGKTLTWISTAAAFITIWMNLGVFREFIQGGMLLYGALAAGVVVVVLIALCFSDPQSTKENWPVYLIAAPLLVIGAANGALVFGFLIPFLILPGLAFLISGFVFGYLRFEVSK